MIRFIRPKEPIFKTCFSALRMLCFFGFGMPVLAAEASLEEGAVYVPCGGDFHDFITAFSDFAVEQGVTEDAVRNVQGTVVPLDSVLKLDRSQSSFKQNFLEFSSRTVSQGRLQIGAQKIKEYRDVFARAEDLYGAPSSVIAAFWAMETDFGAVQGDTNTLSALATLSHDCRRPELFQPQLLAAMTLVEQGVFDPTKTTGAWAGEIGQVQMLPQDILQYAVDGDADGQINLERSASDAILSAAHMLAIHGWERGMPWIEEVVVPDDRAWTYSGLDQKKTLAQWQALGVRPKSGEFLTRDTLEASLVAPQGRFGPIFLTYPNYDVFLRWNQSFIYTLSAAYMATRFDGARAYDAGSPEPGLSSSEVRILQERLSVMGYDVGKIDGIIGAKTRNAVRDVQIKHNMVSDGWPTRALLDLSEG